MGTCHSKKHEGRHAEDDKHLTVAAIELQKECYPETATPGSDTTEKTHEVVESPEPQEPTVGSEIRRLKIEAARARLLSNSDSGTAKPTALSEPQAPTSSRMITMTGEIAGSTAGEKLRQDKILAAQRRLQEAEEKNEWSRRKSYRPDESGRTNSSLDADISERSTPAHENPESDKKKPLHEDSNTENPSHSDPTASFASTSSVTTTNSSPEPSVQTSASVEEFDARSPPVEEQRDDCGALDRIDPPLPPPAASEALEVDEVDGIEALSQTTTVVEEPAENDTSDASSRTTEASARRPLSPMQTTEAGPIPTPPSPTTERAPTPTIPAETALSPTSPVPTTETVAAPTMPAETIPAEEASSVPMPTSESETVPVPTLPAETAPASPVQAVSSPATPAGIDVAPTRPTMELEETHSYDDYSVPLDRPDTPPTSIDYTIQVGDWGNPIMPLTPQAHDTPAMDSTSYDTDGSSTCYREEEISMPPFLCNLDEEKGKGPETNVKVQEEPVVIKYEPQEPVIGKQEPEPTFFPIDFAEIEDKKFRRVCTKMLKRLNHNPWDEFKKYFDEDVCDYILEHPDSCKVRYDFDNFSGQIFPLSVICTMGSSVRTVRLACEAYPDALEFCDVWIGTPLHFACSYKAKLDVIKFLGARSPEMLEKKNLYGRTPLHMSCLFHSNVQTLQYLLEANPEATQIGDKDSNTPLHLACENGATSDKVQLLVNANASVATSVNKDDSTPLHLACAGSGKNMKAVVKVLIETNPIALQYLDYLGCSPLHVLVKNANCGPKSMLTVAKLIVKTIPEIRDAFDDQGQTAMRIAKRRRLPADLLQVLESD